MGFSHRPEDTTFRFSDDVTDVLRYESDFVPRSRLINLFQAEQALRELTQREERLRYRAIALQKAMAIESDGAQLENANKQLEEAQAQYPRKEHALHQAISMLRPAFKDAYHRLRRDVRWFMREEMVQDCSDRGGCCEKGHLSKWKKGRGHCTTECWCCIGFRGFEFSEEEKEEMSKDIETMLKAWGSSHVIHLANWFFCPLEPQTFFKSRWQRILRRG